MPIPAASLPTTTTYVSRAGIKLHHALHQFQIDPVGLICADFGSNVGGFTDCLLTHGAAKVYSIDTGYGVLAWKLRQDPRVVVMERTNALHVPPPPEPDRLQLIVVDLGWTPQRLAIPAALNWLEHSPSARIITLIKPHYEVRPDEKSLLHKGILSQADSERIALRTIDTMPKLGVRVVQTTTSPLLGGESKKNTHGNAEYLALLQRA